jgi:hypothetical protein
MASKMNPRASEASMLGSMLNTMLLRNWPGEYTTASSVKSRPSPLPRVLAMRWPHSAVRASREGKVCIARTTSRSSNSRQSGSNSGSVG